MKIFLPKDALKMMFAECDRFDHEETGGRLLGVMSSSSGELRIRVTGLIDAGPAALRTGTYFLQDGVYQESIFRAKEAKYPLIEHVGNWHTHHANGLGTLSKGDFDTYRKTVNHPKYNSEYFYALLMTERNEFPETWMERYSMRHFLFKRGTQTMVEINPRDVRLIDAALW
jgi:hypothetical protein